MVAELFIALVFRRSYLIAVFKPSLFQLLVLLVSSVHMRQNLSLTAPSKAGNAWSADMPITWAEDKRVKFLEDKSKLYLEWQHWNLENLEMFSDWIIWENETIVTSVILVNYPKFQRESQAITLTNICDIWVPVCIVS